MKFKLPLFLCLQELIKLLKKFLSYVIKLILFNLNKREIPAKSHFGSIYQKDAFECAKDVRGHRAITKVGKDDSRDGYGVHARLDDAGPFLLHFLRVFGPYNKAPKVKAASPLLEGFLSYVVVQYRVFDVLPHDFD
jgi:hypothetical protein